MRSLLALTIVASLVACSKGSGDGPASTSTTTAAPAKTTAATTTASAATTAAPSGGACSIVGAWTGKYPPGPYPFSNTPFDLVFKADGTGTTDSQRAHDVELAWKMDGATLAFHGTKGETGGRYACPRDQDGRYVPS